MKRRFIITAIAVLIVLIAASALTSCSNPGKRTVWYAYFGDCSIMFAYNGKTNTLFEIFLPTETIALWAKENNIRLMTDAIELFSDRKPASFFTGTPDTHTSIRLILEMIGSDGSKEGNLDAMMQNAEVLSKDPLLSKISRLCGTSYRDLAHLAASAKPEAVCIEADSFLCGDSPESEREYFVRWVNQILD